MVQHQHDQTQCMVIYQDKVNASDFGTACKSLEKAADLLSKSTGIDEVLLVVNVIGASEKTKSQKAMKWPYILVRNHEIRDYYSRNFASMVKFARQRHLLTLKN